MAKIGNRAVAPPSKTANRSSVIVARISSVRKTNRSPASSDAERDRLASRGDRPQAGSAATSATATERERGVEQRRPRSPPPVRAITSPAQRRADHRGDLPAAAVPGHGAADQLASGTSCGMIDHRAGMLTAWPTPASTRQQVDQPDRPPRRTTSAARPSEARRQQRLRGHDQALAAVAVGRVARRERQEEHREHLHQADQAQGRRRPGPLVELPADGHPLHLGPDRGQDPRRSGTGDSPPAAAPRRGRGRGAGRVSRRCP